MKHHKLRDMKPGETFLIPDGDVKQTGHRLFMKLEFARQGVPGISAPKGSEWVCEVSEGLIWNCNADARVVPIDC